MNAPKVHREKPRRSCVNCGDLSRTGRGKDGNGPHPRHCWCPDGSWPTDEPNPVREWGMEWPGKAGVLGAPHEYQPETLLRWRDRLRAGKIRAEVPKKRLVEWWVRRPPFYPRPEPVQACYPTPSEPVSGNPRGNDFLRALWREDEKRTQALRDAEALHRWWASVADWGIDQPGTVALRVNKDGYAMAVPHVHCANCGGVAIGRAERPGWKCTACGGTPGGAKGRYR